MNKYPKINYIGNKEKVANWIIDKLPIKEGKVLDLFCGGCSVSYALKKEGFEVITNDILYSNFCISKALIENSNVKLSLDIDENNINYYFNDNIYRKIKWLENRLYYPSEVIELSCILQFATLLKGYEKFLFLSLLRRAMIRKIPYSRMNIKWEEIVKLRDEEYSYRKYKRRRAYHNKTFLYHIKNNLDQYNLAVINNNCKNKAYHMDAFDLLKAVKDKFNLIYIDPPYPSTMNKYDEFYGVFDLMFDEKINHVDFTDKNLFLSNMYELINLSKYITKYIAISMNTRSKPSLEELVNCIRNEVKNINIYTKEHSYKVTSKQNKNNNSEVLIVLEV